jgi:hypothetical protein
VNEPIDYAKLPESLRGGLRRYIEEHIRPGDFLYAVLADSLSSAVMLADDGNRERLLDIARWVYNEAPPMCHGSREKVEAWISSEWL